MAGNEGRSLEDWQIVSRNASGSCLSSTSGLIVLVGFLSAGALVGSLAAGNPGALVGGLLFAALPVVACRRIKVAMVGGEIHVINRIRRFRVSIVDISEISAGLLDRDPKSPPILIVVFSRGGRQRKVQIDATASSSAAERTEIAVKFRSIGLNPGPERRYLEW